MRQNTLRPLWNIFFLCASIFVVAQESHLKDVFIASPNAAALGKFVDVPVNTHTGIPQITLPIHEFREGSLSLPISLNYHAGGLKVQENASWVGAGWSLNAGGMITRTVKGGWPDEDATYGLNNHFMRDGGYENYAYNAQMVWNDICGRTDLKGITYAGNLDYEPDIFFFNFLGYTGKFFVGPNNEAVMVPEQPLHIEIELDPNDAGKIDGWNVSDQMGVTYHFGRTSHTNDTDPIELNDTYTKSGGVDVAGDVVSSWFLNKIESSSGDVISIEYEPEKYATYSVSLFNNHNGRDAGPVNQISVAKVGIRGVRVSKIKSTSAEVNFIADQQPRQDLMRHFLFHAGDDLEDHSNVNTSTSHQSESARALRRIEISNINGFCKAFEFEQDYWYDDTPAKGVLVEIDKLGGLLGTLETDKYRLYLKSVQEKSCDGLESIPAYTFSYYDSHNVPRRLSFAMDHWGFYNAAPNEHLMPPTSDDGGASFTSLNSSRPVADRESSWPEMRAGTLRQVKYPTGGTTTYQYGPHQLKNLTNCQFSMGENAGNASQFGVAGWSNVKQFTSTSGAVYFTITTNGEGVVGKVKIDGQEYTESGLAYVSKGTVPYQVYLSSSSFSDGITSKGYSVQLKHAIASNCTEVIQTVGGLRLEKLIQNDGIGENPDLITTYEYVDELGEPTGVLFSQPAYIAVIQNEEKKYGETGSIPFDDHWSVNGCRARNYHDPNTSFFTVQGPQSVHPLGTSQGNHFGYRYVKKKYTEGYEVFKYDITNGITVGPSAITEVDARQCLPSYKEYPTPPENYVFGRGDLIFSGSYNDSGQPLRESYVNSTYRVNEAGEVGGLLLVPFGSEFLPARYEIRTGHLGEKVVRTIDYYSAEPHERITTSFYSTSYPYLASSLVVEDPLNALELSRLDRSYASDLLEPSCPSSNTCYLDFLLAKGAIENTFELAINDCAQNLTSCSLPGNNWDYCSYFNYLVYSYDLNEARKQLKQCITSADTDRESCLASERSGSTLLNRLIDLVVNYREGALIEEVSSTTGSFSVANYFEYNDQLQVQKVKDQFGYVGKTFNPVQVVGSDLSVDAEYQDVQSIQYNGEQIIEIRSRDGLTTSFLWSESGVNDRDHPIARVVGAPYTLIKSIYDASGGSLNTLRDHPSMVKALITTYEFEPLKGLIAITDPSGSRKSYRYDKLGRLLEARDPDNHVELEYQYHYANH